MRIKTFGEKIIQLLTGGTVIAAVRRGMQKIRRQKKKRGRDEGLLLRYRD